MLFGRGDEKGGEREKGGVARKMKATGDAKEKGKKDKSGMKGKKSSGTMPGGAQVYSLRQGSSEATLVLVWANFKGD